MFSTLARSWRAFAEARPTLAQLVVFCALNVGMTLLQLIMLPVARLLLGGTGLEDISFQWLQLGSYYVFDYPSGPLPSGGGGLAYFLAVQIALGIAQVVNFFAQRNITFKSDSDPWIAAAWYLVAYMVITIGAAALQGLYKTPIYEFFIETAALGSLGETAADATTMLINALISCAVYFPIFKVIFPSSAPEPQRVEHELVS